MKEGWPLRALSSEPNSRVSFCQPQYKGFSPSLSPGSVGLRTTFADIGESIAHWLGLAPGKHGRSFL